MQMRFKFLVEDIDRYGNVRLYVRVPGRRKVRLRSKDTSWHRGRRLKPRLGRSATSAFDTTPARRSTRSIGRRNHGVGGRSIRSVRSMPASQSLLCSLVMSGNCETN
jgi:hypothetical protein